MLPAKLFGIFRLLLRLSNDTPRLSFAQRIVRLHFQGTFRTAFALRRIAAGSVRDAYLLLSRAASESGESWLPERSLNSQKLREISSRQKTPLNGSATPPTRFQQLRQTEYAPANARSHKDEFSSLGRNEASAVPQAASIFNSRGLGRRRQRISRSKRA